MHIIFPILAHSWEHRNKNVCDLKHWRVKYSTGQNYITFRFWSITFIEVYKSKGDIFSTGTVYDKPRMKEYERASKA